MRARHAVASEADRIREIRLQALQSDADAFGSTYERDRARPARWWERIARLSEAGVEQRTFVLVDEQDVWLGLAIVRPDDESPGDAVLNAMWVAPSVRGRGGAGLLCSACSAWARGRGFPTLNLNVKVSNESAVKAYAKAGFVFVRVERDEHVMARRLV